MADSRNQEIENLLVTISNLTTQFMDTSSEITDWLESFGESLDKLEKQVEKACKKETQLKLPLTKGSK